MQDSRAAITSPLLQDAHYPHFATVYTEKGRAGTTAMILTMSFALFITLGWPTRSTKIRHKEDDPNHPIDLILQPNFEEPPEVRDDFVDTDEDDNDLRRYREAAAAAAEEAAAAAKAAASLATNETTAGAAAANAAKTAGNNFFIKKTEEGYYQALGAYKEALKHDPENKLLHGNICACQLELANLAYQPFKRMERYAKALLAARECTKRDPLWAKAWQRQASAELELVKAGERWRERQQEEAEWQKQDEAYAMQKREEDISPWRRKTPSLNEALKQIADGASFVSCEASCRKGLELEPNNVVIRERLQALRDSGYVTDEAKDRETRDPTAAADFKAKGNAAFTAQKWLEAADMFTKAIEQDPFDHVFYSNRAACYAELDQFENALRDAKNCIKIDPKFVKGYSRKAYALFHLGMYPEMEATAKAGLALDPDNDSLKELLKMAQEETKESPETQKAMHLLRVDKRREANMQRMMSQLSMQGRNVNVFNAGAGGNDLSGLVNMIKNQNPGAGTPGMPGFSGSKGKANLSEEQMRNMARVVGNTR
eukprot:gnl/MRDRNA2_/MRDRNA2_69104_c0_seq1.p1 gnl/MRDRNA2_/MRDRNA2_69104_c0~~gnl/MRDRNA2_/MRDRNA2_69104_c0_seq1.p1  ORF type:complete len:543 (+),score=137.53 gnl/MRDRNA2_/MRDRNA2_69104_c0_seq1:114-1742(+)